MPYDCGKSGIYSGASCIYRRKTGRKPGKQNPQIEGTNCFRTSLLILLKRGGGNARKCRAVSEAVFDYTGYASSRQKTFIHNGLAALNLRLYVHSGHCGVAADADGQNGILLPGEGLSHEAEPVLLLPGAELSRQRRSGIWISLISEDGAVGGYREPSCPKWPVRLA